MLTPTSLIRLLHPLTLALAFGGFALPLAGAAEDDAKIIAALDTEFQAAVKANDPVTIDRILADDMVLVTGRGRVFTKAQHIEAARERSRTYERQDELPGTQTVRMVGRDAAILTALLWIKGTDKEGQSFDYKVWFSDTYVRTPQGWRYAFGQASLPLPPEEKK